MVQTVSFSIADWIVVRRLPVTGRGLQLIDLQLERNECKREIDGVVFLELQFAKGSGKWLWMCRGEIDWFPEQVYKAR